MISASSREAVSRLGFDRGGAAAEEPVRVAAGGGEQVVVRSFTRVADGRADAPAGRRDLGVGGALHAAFKLPGAVAREYRMRVSVDKAGKNDASARIDDFGVRGAALLDFRARTHCDDLAVAYTQTAIGDDREFAHGRSRARTRRAGQGDNLAAVHDGEIGLHPSCLQRAGLPHS